MSRPPCNVAEMRGRARRILPKVLFDFIEGGSDDEVTVAWNRESLERVQFRPRMGVHVRRPDLTRTVLGCELSMPVLLAPVGGLSIVHPDGQAGAARAAAAAGTRAVVGTLSGSALEDTSAEAAGVPHWFQLYYLGGRAGAEVLVERARAAGYGVLVVTVDTPIVGHKERDIRNGGVHPGGMPIQRVDLPSVVRFGPQVALHPLWAYRFAHSGFALGQPNFTRLSPDGGPMTPEDATARWMAEPVTWKDFGWIREAWQGPIVAKGILSADDARIAVDHGADGVVISNHGGRQLDGSPATIDLLPGVVAAVGDRCDVLIDSGFRRGSDVVRAIALGATAVLVGRPYVYGLAVRGERGVAAILDIVRAELTRTLQLLGCPSVAALDASYLHGPPPAIPTSRG